MGDIVDLDVADNSVRHRKPAIGVSRNGCIWTPPHCKHSDDDKHGATAYVYSASVVGIR